MAESRGRYPPEYREQMVELVRSGRSARSLAREFDPSEQTIRNWVKQADLDEGRRSDGLTTEARLELRRLKRGDAKARPARDLVKPGLLGRGSEPVVGGRHHIRAQLGGVAVPRRGAGRMEPSHRGWAMAPHLRTELVEDALAMAIFRRRPRGRGGSITPTGARSTGSCSRVRESGAGPVRPPVTLPGQHG